MASWSSADSRWVNTSAGTLVRTAIVLPTVSPADALRRRPWSAGRAGVLQSVAGIQWYGSACRDTATPTRCRWSPACRGSPSYFRVGMSSRPKCGTPHQVTACPEDIYRHRNRQGADRKASIRSGSPTPTPATTPKLVQLSVSTCFPFASRMSEFVRRPRANQVPP